MAKIIIFVLICLGYLYPLYVQWNVLPFFPYLLIGIVGIAIAIVLTGIALFQGSAEYTFKVFVVSVILIYGLGLVLPGLFHIDTLNGAFHETVKQVN
jgi:hypothetical protein